MNNYTPLAASVPLYKVALPRIPDPGIQLLGFEAPALELMTDFRRTPAISIHAATPVDDALNQMIYSGVRLLFVVDADFDVLGSITSYDIQSEKPMLFLQSRDCRIGTCTRDDILVQDIMTPVRSWRALKYRDLADATLGNVAQTFNSLRVRHLIVLDTISAQGIQSVRGLFSASVVERALGIQLDAVEIAESFAEIEHELVRD
jgi:CBS-domain-containing membrane protein